LAALLTMLGDVLKGWFAVLVALFIGLPIEWVALVGFAAFLGPNGEKRCPPRAVRWWVLA